MRWLKAELLAACLVFGCGSAMGGPDQNQQYPQQQYPQQAPQQAPQGGYPGPQAPDPNPSSEQTPMDQNQTPATNEDAAVESFEYATGQSHLGVVVMGMTRDLRQFFGAPPDRGVIVAHVEQNSPAARAGVQVGDILMRVSGQKIQSTDDVISALAAQPTGRARLDVIRQGRRLRIDAMIQPPRTEQRPNNSML